MPDVVYINRYDRHCLDKLLGTTTEARLVEEGHRFTLSDGTEYIREGERLLVISDVDPTPIMEQQPEEEPEL